MLKENDSIRKLLHVDVWHKAGYTGKNMAGVILDGPDGKPRKNMPYYTDVFGKATNSGHATNVAQNIHEIAPDTKLLYFDNTRNKDAVFEWVKAHKDEIDFINVSMAGLKGMTADDYLRYEALGIPMICASGNDGYKDHISYPARYHFTIAIGATNIAGDDVDSYSNGGPMLNAVCVSHIAILNDDGKVWRPSGTSHASPTATGLLFVYGDWRKVNGLPKPTPTEIFKFVESNCIDIEDEGFDYASGYGLFCLPETIPTVVKMEGAMNGIDCATKLTAASAQNLKQSGIEVVGRYLGRTLWNGLTQDEVKAIRGAGLALFLIWELTPTNVLYFDYAKGLSDAKQAISEAEYLGAPHGIAIYFTVDYDVQASDMSAIKGYFEGIRAGLEGKYLLGAYGSYAVIQTLAASAYAPDRYFQTYAWSGGKQFSGNHIYQYSNDVMVAGVALDKDQVSESAGLWKEEEDVLEVAILKYSAEDEWSAKDIDAQLGGVANFTRQGTNKVIPAAALSAKKLIIIGGPDVPEHSNRVYLSGQTKFDTAAAVGKYLG